MSKWSQKQEEIQIITNNFSIKTSSLFSTKNLSCLTHVINLSQVYTKKGTYLFIFCFGLKCTISVIGGGENAFISEFFWDLSTQIWSKINANIKTEFQLILFFKNVKN